LSSSPLTITTNGKEIKVAINASPLIFLAKAELLYILKELFGTIYTTKSVMDEIKKPLKLGYEAPEIRAIEKLRWIKVIELNEDEKRLAEKIAQELKLSKGEVEVAILCKKMKLDLMVLADRFAEKRLKSIGINTEDIIDIGFEAARRELIDIRDFLQKVWHTGYKTRRLRKILFG